MATVVSQHVRHLELFKNIFCPKLQQIFLKLAENMYLQPHE